MLPPPGDGIRMQDLREVIRSLSRVLTNGVSVLVRQTQGSPWLLPVCEYTVGSQQSAAWRRALNRYQICKHLNHGLPRFQNCKK